MSQPSNNIFVKKEMDYGHPFSIPWRIKEEPPLNLDYEPSLLKEVKSEPPSLATYDLSSSFGNSDAKPLLEGDVNGRPCGTSSVWRISNFGNLDSKKELLLEGDVNGQSCGASSVWRMSNFENLDSKKGDLQNHLNSDCRNVVWNGNSPSIVKTANIKCVNQLTPLSVNQLTPLSVNPSPLKSLETSLKRGNPTPLNSVSLYVCDSCDHRSAFKDKMIHHFLESHNIRQELECSYCKYSTPHKSTLGVHMARKHLKDEAWNCKECNKTFYLKWDVISHIRKVHSKPLKNIIEAKYCSHCEFKTTTDGDLQNHMNSNHRNVVSTGNTPSIVKAANIMSVNQSTPVSVNPSSLKKVNPTPMNSVKLYGCDSCDYRSAYKDKIIHHFLETHNMREKLRCFHCKYTTPKKSTLRVHMARKHLKDKPWNCEECNKTFYLLCYLTKHVRAIHLNLKPLKNKSCPLCNYKSHDNTAVQIHYKTQHLGVRIIKDAKYICHHCSKCYPNLCNLRYHIIAKHLPSKRVRCKVCKVSFSSRSGLKIHIDTIHTEKKRYCCSKCDYKAARPDYLAKHINSCHTNAKPYKCPHCPLTTTRSDNLKAHIRRLHSKYFSS